MTNEEMVARGLGTIGKTGTNTTGYDIGTNIGNILTSTAKSMQDTYGSYIDAQIAAANMANSASAQAQAQQYLYNKEFMNMQNLQQEEYMKRMMDFNTQSAKEANAFTEKMWNKAADYNQNIFNAQNAFNREMWQRSADYNSREAQAQRAWQEEMSATAYQRAIKDMKAAGINPILAAQNGGANIGSGATASIGTASSGSANMGATSGAQAGGINGNAAGGNVGNYSGQGYHLSDTMALFGAVIGTLGQVMNGLQANNSFGKAGEKIETALKDTGNAVRNTIQGTLDSITETSEKYWNNWTGKTQLDKANEAAKNGDYKEWAYQMNNLGKIFY